MSTRENTATSNKVYFIGTKCSLSQLAKQVGIVDTPSGKKEIVYMGFWDNVCIVEYDGNTDFYTFKENILNDSVYHICNGGATFINYCNDNNIQFVGGPFSQFFTSYAMAYLTVIRWAADVAYTKELWNELVQE